jgi:hypothetical protein
LVFVAIVKLPLPGVSPIPAFLFKIYFGRMCIYFNKSCQPDHPNKINETLLLDGIITTGYFKSTHGDHSFSITDGICLYNSYYNRILDRFFNIAYYLIEKANPKIKISETKMVSLNSDLEATGYSSIRSIPSDPNKNSLK